ncbi:hypothetical protein EV659_1172 [Rhodothalassium salexigens DSM 2132]|uniref:DUF91 domain-containing protein n=1 Tax=Rhodothalassium salexigens DSM 2132 TaxID=1188247 RepID=A0A4R2P7T4_RHOSA|nr:hypothetical protein [Rhodothalassium salexigens]MBB4212774.1 hypothetical protein [Rhodothalassium salexigens DSM 2132]MBK1639781.1 hypothetical protein [Rhodothalassium salexigens DSM 2132]TCP29895.1 hypothetical protein EV659_1172 [Rhodothalassium salexigens DSM 2132]
MTRLFQIEANKLIESRRKPLDFEAKIESWVASDLSLIGVDGVVIGRQVSTDHGKQIDILAMDQGGNLIIVELKRDKSPRDIVAQVLDYASWVCRLTTNDVHEIAYAKQHCALADIYREKFDQSLPETLNATHQMIVVASEVDEATKRIIEYLSEEHSVGINASFFNVFEQDGREWLTTDALLEQEKVADRATRKARGPWSGYYYLTGGSEADRRWEPMRKHGFFSAHGGRFYTDKLGNLSEGDQVFYYQKGNGYLGYGIVTHEKMPADQFVLEDGRKLVDVAEEDYLKANADDADLACYVVGIDWKKTFPVSEPQSFNGIFANQNVVCKIYQQETADFLAEKFGAEKGKS